MGILAASEGQATGIGIPRLSREGTLPTFGWNPKGLHPTGKGEMEVDRLLEGL